MITVISKCPNCGYIGEFEGDYLEAVSLKTKESWVIECNKCHNVFLDSIQEKVEK